MKIYIFVIGITLSLLAPAQDVDLDKIEKAKQLFSVQLSTATNEQLSKAIRFYEQCSDSDKQAIRSYMVGAITDSLKAGKKQFAINLIDYYRLIANPDDEYLGSLVVTEGKYYYDLMDETKLSELADYLNEIAIKSEMDYSAELSELRKRAEEIARSGEELTGCWLMYNTNEKYGHPQEIINIAKKDYNQYSVSYLDPQLAIAEAGSIGALIQNIVGIPSKGIADTCYLTRPNELFYFFSSEKLRKNNEILSSGLRGAVRGAGNSVIGQLARSENFSSQLFGWFGVIGAESIFNSLIDDIAVSRKSWYLREGYATKVNQTQMDIRYTYFIYKMTSKDTGVSVPKIKNVNSVLYRYPENCDIAFIDMMSGLITNRPLTKIEAKKYYEEHPEAKKASKSKKKRLLYNMQQWEKLKEYNKTY